MTAARRRLTAALALAVALVVSACGPAGALAPVEGATPASSPSAAPHPTAVPSSPPSPAPTPAPAATAAAPPAPPPAPPMPAPQPVVAELAVGGPAPVAGQTYAVAIACQPRIMAWLGDAAREPGAADRVVVCEEGAAFVIELGVPGDRAALLAPVDQGDGMPIAHRTPTGQPFGEEAVAELRQVVGADRVAAQLRCERAWDEVWVGDDVIMQCFQEFISIRFADVSLTDLLTRYAIGQHVVGTVTVWP